MNLEIKCNCESRPASAF